MLAWRWFDLVDADLYTQMLTSTLHIPTDQAKACKHLVQKQLTMFYIMRPS